MYADLGTKVLSRRMILKNMDAVGIMISSVYNNIFKLVAITIPQAKAAPPRQPNSTSLTTKSNTPTPSDTRTNTSTSTGNTAAKVVSKRK